MTKTNAWVLPITRRSNKWLWSFKEKWPKCVTSTKVISLTLSSSWWAKVVKPIRLSSSLRETLAMTWSQQRTVFSGSVTTSTSLVSLTAMRRPCSNIHRLQALRNMTPTSTSIASVSRTAALDWQRLMREPCQETWNTLVDPLYSQKAYTPSQPCIGQFLCQERTTISCHTPRDT